MFFYFLLLFGSRILLLAEVAAEAAETRGHIVGGGWMVLDG